MAKANKVSTQNGVAGIMPTTPDTQNRQVAALSWRQATLRKTAIGEQTTGTMSGATQPVDRVIEGTGYLCGVDLDFSVLTALNAAAVAYNADAPWNAISNVALKATGPDIINVTGYGLFLANLYAGNGTRNPALSLDPNIYLLTAGAGATGGSFRAKLRVPLSINWRSLMGALGNQDRAAKYQLRTDVAPDTQVYTVLPTAPGAFTLNRYLDFATVPAAQSDVGQSQQQVPSWYGVIHTITQLTSEAQPVASSTINHFIRSIGNTFRTMIMEFRLATGVRSDTMLPTRINLMAGSDTVYTETSDERRKIMYDRYGFDAPAGVLVYDYISDFVQAAGFEMGDDYLNTAGLANLQFQLTYPAFAGGAGQLSTITDAIIVPDGIDISTMM